MAAFLPGTMEWGITKLTESEDQAADPIGCASSKTAIKLRMRRPFQETFSYSLFDGSLRDNYLGRFGYHASHIF